MVTCLDVYVGRIPQTNNPDKDDLKGCEECLIYPVAMSNQSGVNGNDSSVTSARTIKGAEMKCSAVGGQCVGHNVLGEHSCSVIAVPNEGGEVSLCFF
jgi:hypothetical protein